MLKRIIQLLFTVAILWFVFTHISFSEVRDVFSSLRYRIVFASIAIYVGVYILRAYRFGLILPQIDFFSRFHLVSKNSFFNIALPFKFGDLALAPMIKKDHDTSLVGGISVLIVARIYDLFSVVFLFIFSCIFFFKGTILSYVFSFIFIVLVSLAFLLIQKYKKISGYIRKTIIFVGKTLKIDKKSWYELTYRKADELLNQLSVINDSHISIKMMISSLIIWIGLYLVYFVVLLEGGLNLSFILFVFGCSFAFFANALPLSLVGSWGIQEAGWAAGFILVGLTKEFSMATGVTTHILVTIYSMIIFISTFIIKRIRKMT